MIGSIIEIALGWFVTFKLPSILKVKKGTQGSIIRLIGWLLMIAGVISFVRSVLSF